MRQLLFATSAFGLVLMSVPALAAEGAGGKELSAAEPVKPEKKSEWEIKPRWRLQYDWANVSGPAGLAGTGNSEEIRRAQLGVDIKMPGGFSARVEGEFTADPIEFVDAFVAWNGKGFNVTAGQQKFFTPLDDTTSDLNTSFTERAAFVTAFNFARRTGVSAGYAKGAFQINAGVATDALIQLDDVDDNSLSADVRAVWMPQIDKTKSRRATSGRRGCSPNANRPMGSRPRRSTAPSILPARRIGSMRPAPGPATRLSSEPMPRSESS
jgi:phosphate-selective porin OprO/OprP